MTASLSYDLANPNYETSSKRWRLERFTTQLSKPDLDKLQGVLRDCLQSQIGTVVKQSVLSIGFTFDEFWHFSKKFDTLISF